MIPESRLIAVPGWLSPEGKYYPCEYESHLRHAEIASLICWHGLVDPKSDFWQDDQDYLIEQGWVRVDVNLCLSNGEVTFWQADKLQKLIGMCKEFDESPIDRDSASFVINQYWNGDRK